MIAALFAHITSMSLLAAEGSAPGWLVLLGPAGGGGVYYGLWRYYRNTDKSHGYEHETRVTAKPITGYDAKVSEVKGTKASSINGANHTNHRQRVRRVG